MVSHEKPTDRITSSSPSVAPQGGQSGPSGIAQLRKHSENNAAQAAQAAQADQMNLDDFIFSDQAGSPAGLESPAQTNDAAATGSGIPIKARKNAPAAAQAEFVPQSVPDAPNHQRTKNDEFNYVQRHVRKTSIDDRRVSCLPRSHRPSPLPH